MSKSNKVVRGPTGPKTSLAGKQGTNRPAQGPGPGKAHESYMTGKGGDAKCQGMDH